MLITQRQVRHRQPASDLVALVDALGHRRFAVAPLRPVAGRGDVGLLAVDRFMDRRAG